MFFHSFFIFALLFVSGKTNNVSPINKMIKLALGVSKSTYLPLKRNEYIQNGHIVGYKKASTKYDPNNVKVVCNVGGWVGTSFEKAETEVLLFTHAEQKLAIFGFRGTESTNLVDWAKNFKTKLVEAIISSSNFKLHQGFRDRYFDIQEWFENKYKALPQDYTIIITGHSLGGAMTTVAATYASGKLNRRPDAVITFASPLVGGKEFRDYYRNVVGCDRTLRIVNEGDFITATPLNKEYTHVCDALKVNGNSGWLSSLNVVKIHSLYNGYGPGLAKFANIDFGCDKKL